MKSWTDRICPYCGGACDLVKTVDQEHWTYEVGGVANYVPRKDRYKLKCVKCKRYRVIDAETFGALVANGVV